MILTSIAFDFTASRMATINVSKAQEMGMTKIVSTNESTAVGSIVDVHDTDEDILRDIGYKQVRLPIAHTSIHPGCGSLADIYQELKREFTRWSTLSYAVAVQGLLGSGQRFPYNHLMEVVTEAF